MKIFAPAQFFDRTTQPHVMTLVALACISALAMNIFLPSLPSMAAYYNTTPSVISLSVAVYLGASAVIQLFSGPLSDRIGRRPVILFSLALFIFASLAIIWAPTVEMFLVLRFIQAFAATTMVLSRAIVRDTVGKNAAASKIAYVTMGTAVAPMLGPGIGGYLDTYFGWQSVFAFLGAIGLVIFLITWFDLGETAPLQASRQSSQKADYMELLLSQRFWGYCVSSALGSGSFFIYLGGAPFVGTEVFGLSPEQLGLYFGAPSLGYFAGNFISGRYSERFGVDAMVISGLTFTVSGTALSLIVSTSGNGSVLSFFGFMCFVGLGNGLTIPNATAGMLSVRPHLAGTASGLGSAIMIGGGAALSALAGTVVSIDAGETPLLLQMETSAILGFATMLLVLRRQRQLAKQESLSTGPDRTQTHP
jgi:DHA1 family bicyclomycin/chloramphenicol resistance-like MFS transporter